MPTEYLRDRPFLVVDIYYKPARNVRTEKPGWTLEPKNWVSEEVPRIVDRVTEKMLRQATVIIDVNNNAFVKNRFAGHEPSEIRDHYVQKYAGIIQQGMTAWMHRMIAKARQRVTDPLYRATIDKIEAEV